MENKTWNDYVRDYWPEATDDECADLLRDHMSPFAGPEELLAELDDYMVNVMHRSKGDA